MRANKTKTRYSRIRQGYFIFFFFSSRRRHTRSDRDWSSDVYSSDLELAGHRELAREPVAEERRAPSRPRTGARGEEGFPTGLVPERRVEVERRARRAHVVLRHEGDRRAHEVGDLLGPVLVEGRAVGHLERVGVAEIDLLLAAPPFALRRLDRHVGPLHPVPNRADQRLLFRRLQNA